jgi:hypothetical protein
MRLGCTRAVCCEAASPVPCVRRLATMTEYPHTFLKSELSSGNPDPKDHCGYTPALVALLSTRLTHLTRSICLRILFIFVDPHTPTFMFSLLSFIFLVLYGRMAQVASMKGDVKVCLPHASKPKPSYIVCAYRHEIAKCGTIDTSVRRRLSCWPKQVCCNNPNNPNPDAFEI